MPEVTLSYDDSAAYERFMGSWSRKVAPVFLDWIDPPSSARWLEVGCGTGIFTQFVVDRFSPQSVIAIDSSQAQIEHARRLPLAAHVDFRAGDALSLPFSDAAFDIVVSALVINFVEAPARAVTEMRRVVRTGGMVAGYVWDFSAERSPSGPMRQRMRMFGMSVPGIPGAQASSASALAAMFKAAQFEGIATRSIEVTKSFPDFDTFWRAQTPSYSPATKMIAAMPDAERQKLIDTVREGLPLTPDGRIEYSACANAIRAYVP